MHFASAVWQASLHYFERGGTLLSTALSELHHAQLDQAISAAGLGGVLWSTHLPALTNSSTVAPSLHAMLRFLGTAPLEEERLVLAAESAFSRARRRPDETLRWVGCHLDVADSRGLPEGPRSFGHTSQACAAACTGYPLFGLQGGGQCFCGHAYVGGANHTRVADNKCGRVCPGEGGKLPARLCGGGWRNAVFAQSGDLLPVR